MGEVDHKRNIYRPDNEHEHGVKRPKYNEIHKHGRKPESNSLPSNPLHNQETAISDLTNQGSITNKFDPDSLAIRVSLEVNKGEYNLNLRSVPTDNAMAEHAHTAAVLVSQRDLLRKLGLKLLSKL